MNDEHDNAVTDREMLDRAEALQHDLLRERWAAMSENPNGRCRITRSRGPWQDADNKASLYYYDFPRMLAFHWQGDVTRPIEVSWGGDHEQPAWVFLFQYHRPRRIIAGTLTLVQAFEKTCKNWIASMEEGF